MVRAGHINPGGDRRIVRAERRGLVALRHETFLPTTEDTMAEHELLTPGEVAVMFRVDPKTVTRWARAGRLSAIRTIGGHRRFRASEVLHLLEDVPEVPAEG